MREPDPRETPLVLTIAGTDPSGAAGIQVDLQVMRDFGCHGISAITALVCQNTAGVRGFEAVSLPTLQGQLAAIFDDFDLQAIKIGMVPSGASFEVIAAFLEDTGGSIDVVLDPVLASGDGRASLHAEGWFEGLERVRPYVSLLTPNAEEARAILGGSPLEEGPALARALVAQGWSRVLVKGGHLPARADGGVVDVLADATGERSFEPLPRCEADVRGTGCQLASAIACARTRHADWAQAIDQARRYLNELLHRQARVIGRGRPVVVRAKPPEG
ncbi:bifunctional hydroxymethylpyrimidine kinase/phosphomethylpyrimidine kinase [Lujinxingia litoralis]|uniref:hydroxymethylpyrimidine kinase n=1 Tax=Lujinxingia litoralis TaxID=2211119 RepID=A0A328C6U5_9DELT|nr:hydroxymethylpyrimidine/phosphomethylpyrimidine kinase [Lujinxingia litoralis]RAL22184.1 bifunctional hydroxymethylpyrimidine kinase/phosphomethylpyrimidine kinase [Lujinxingia litoralis]